MVSRFTTGGPPGGHNVFGHDDAMTLCVDILVVLLDRLNKFIAQFAICDRRLTSPL
jgi:hypothetical protein